MSTVILLGALGASVPPEPGVGPPARAEFTLKQVPDLRLAASGPAATASFVVKQVPDLRLNAIAPAATATFTALSKIDLTLGGVAHASTPSLTLQWTAKPTLALEVLDPSLDVAPTALTVMVVNGLPAVDVTFAIDGTTVAIATADSQGAVGPLSINVSEALGAVGSHTITATQVGSHPASGTFTLAEPPRPHPIIIGPDASPVDVPGAQTSTGVRRWVLQDLMPGGLGSYILPLNPISMSSPHTSKTLTPMHTTATSGVHHIFEGTPDPHEWEFSGYCTGKAMHDQLLAFDGLNRRFYVLDHRGRAWKVTFRNVDIRLRRRTTTPSGGWNDWTGDYTVNALIYDGRWWEPQ